MLFFCNTYLIKIFYKEIAGNSLKKFNNNEDTKLKYC